MNRLLAFFAALVLLVAALPVVAAAQGSDEERLLKAAYIYNFAKFTRWPGSEGGAGSSLHLCLIGEDPLAVELERLSGKRVGEKRLEIKRIAQAAAPGECHILYVARSLQHGFQQYVTAQASTGVLTVSEISGFARAGGVIELFPEGDRVRFLVNLDAAQGAGLLLSSRLLNLARILGQEVPQ